MRRIKVFLASLAVIIISMSNTIAGTWTGGGGTGGDGAHGVPEPSTMLLLGAGLAGAAIYRKVRNRRKDDE